MRFTEGQWDQGDTKNQKRTFRETYEDDSDPGEYVNVVDDEKPLANTGLSDASKVLPLKQKSETKPNLVRGDGEESSLRSTSSSKSTQGEDAAAKTSNKWTDARRYSLVDEVSSRRALWDITCTMYKDKQHADFEWHKIKDRLNRRFGADFEADEVKKQWKNLRDSFFKRVKSSGRTGSAAEEMPRKWPYFKSMQFLLILKDNEQTWSNVGHLEKRTEERQPLTIVPQIGSIAAVDSMTKSTLGHQRIGELPRKRIEMRPEKEQVCDQND